MHAEGAQHARWIQKNNRLAQQHWYAERRSLQLPSHGILTTSGPKPQASPRLKTKSWTTNDQLLVLAATNDQKTKSS